MSCNENEDIPRKYARFTLCRQTYKVKVKIYDHASFLELFVVGNLRVVNDHYHRYFT